jgi:hypothetical protein
VNVQGVHIRLAIRPPAAIAERGDAAILVALEDLIAGLPRNLELGAQRRHLFALEQSVSNSQILPLNPGLRQRCVAPDV